LCTNFGDEIKIYTILHHKKVPVTHNYIQLDACVTHVKIVLQFFSEISIINTILGNTSVSV